MPEIPENTSLKNPQPPGTKRRVREPLSPSRVVTVITPAGCAQVDPTELRESTIGCKAYGLACLPGEWVPPFFVVTADVLGGSVAEEHLAQLIAAGVNAERLRPEDGIIVRSSGTTETLRERGRLESSSCSLVDILDTIQKLRSRMTAVQHGEVHWIVQRHVSARYQGHLSNLRRVSWEPRDWIAEFEPTKNHRGFTTRLGVRPWRQGNGSLLDLQCFKATKVTDVLRRVAVWGTRLRERTLFEWVWDGNRVYVVQVDSERAASGVRPRSLLPAKIFTPPADALKLFQPALSTHFERFGKLRNAHLYGQLGYSMPAFYVLDNPTIVNGILNGVIDPDLALDLTALTRRPLVIRTDGAAIPRAKREMLPRTEDLRSAEQAKEWLLGVFRADVIAAGLVDCQLCLIAHHFIPSVASAWARAEPQNRIVRIESLWGLPEGLYWFSHDTFEIDTMEVKPCVPSEAIRYIVRRQRLRYKGTFVASNDEGHWVNWETAPPSDWGRSIKKVAWLSQIAYTTRQIAENENKPVAVMWFIDNHPQATPHQVLPWYHDDITLLGSPKAAPRRKRREVTDFSIRTREDWDKLRQNLQNGDRIERVVVDPHDPELIRNRPFAEELGQLAATKRFVVEMSGGILSHAFYVLQRAGAQVECVDLVPFDDDLVEYNKLVRDRIPEIIVKRGERVNAVTLRGQALRSALRRKLVEEAFEALDASSDEELVSELADVKEVVSALCRALNVSTTQLHAEAKQKRRLRGGFEKGLMLLDTAMPHFAEPAGHDGLKLETELEKTGPVVSDVANLPQRPVYRRPDLRRVGTGIEKLFVIETAASNLDEVKELFNFSLTLPDGPEHEFALTIEVHRTRGDMRTTVRLRADPTQLTIPFDGSDQQLELDLGPSLA